MAETSGFATDLVQSAYLATTMRRAISAAQQRSHRYVTLEHLLLALVDDPDAQALFAGLRVDVGAVKSATSDTVNRNLATLYTPGQFDLRASYKVERVLQTASDDARRLNCVELDGAFVLAALSREVDSPASDIVKRNGLGFSNAVTWLYANRGSSYKPAPPQREVQAPPAQPQPQPQARELPPQEREAPRMEQQPIPQPAPRPKVASPQALAEEEALELELEILDDKVQAAPAPPPQPKPAPRPQLSRAEAAVMDEAPPAERRAPPPMPQPAPQIRAPSPQAQPAPAPMPVAASAPMPRLEMRASTQEAPASVAPPRGMETRQRAAPPAREATPAEAPPASARRDTKIPIARLEEMRVRTPGSSSPPAAPTANLPVKSQRRRSDTQKRSGSRRQRGIEAQVGKLVENIPRRMRAGVTECIEVRITREETDAFTRGMDGRGEPVRHELLVTSAMSVMLRAPEGGFVIETLSPETQWILEGVERPEDQNYGRWRWAVTPTEKGQRKLQLVIGARTVDLSGMVGETALPEQIINVRVRTNYIRGLKRLLEWAVVMAAGGVVTELGVKIFQTMTKM